MNILLALITGDYYRQFPRYTAMSITRALQMCLKNHVPQEIKPIFIAELLVD